VDGSLFNFLEDCLNIKLTEKYKRLNVYEKIGMADEYVSKVVREGCCDLHIHTTFSDGADSSAAIVQRVIENRLKCFAVTDHDTIDGVMDVFRVLKKIKSIGMKCPDFIPGIELSVQEESREVHMLGYFPFGGIEKISDFIKIQQNSRQSRNERMCKLLTENGMPITIEELQGEGSVVVGRLHAANIMIRKGYVGSIKEAFDNYLTKGKPCYAGREKPTAREAVEAISIAGGIAVLAHPFLYGWTSCQHTVSDVLIDKLIKLKECGLKGVEVFHGEASSCQSLETKGAADTLGLTVTAGSDYHGANKHGLKMFTSNIEFYKESEEIIVGGIVEVNDKYLLIKKVLGLSDEKWGFPSISLHDSKHNYKKILEDTLSQIIQTRIEAVDYYSTAVYENENSRKVFISYKCTTNEEHIKKITKKDPSIALFTLGEMSIVNLRKLDGIIVDKLREITLI